MSFCPRKNHDSDRRRDRFVPVRELRVSPRSSDSGAARMSGVRLSVVMWPCDVREKEDDGSVGVIVSSLT